MKNVDSYYDFADSSYYTLKRMLEAGIRVEFTNMKAYVL